FGPARLPKEVEQPLRQRLAHGMHIAVTLEGAQVLIDPQEREGPRPWAGKARDRRQRIMEKITTETMPPWIAGAANDSPQHPQRAPVAVLRAVLFEPLPSVRHEIPESSGALVERMADKRQVA